SSLALRGSVDPPGQGEDLDLRPAVLHDAGDHGDRRERVRGDLADRVRDLVQQRGLPDAREPDEANSRVPALLYRVARPAAPALHLPELDLLLEAGAFGLQLPDVGLGRRVVRGLVALV